MFKLNISIQDPTINELLKLESTCVENDAFLFTSKEKAVSVLSKLALFYFRKNEIEQFIKQKKLVPDQIEDFVLCLPSQKISHSLEEIRQCFDKFLKNELSFRFESYIFFRLRPIQNFIKCLFEDNLSEFYELNSYSTDLYSLKKLYSEQFSEENELSLFIYKDRKVVLKSKSKIYLEDSLDNEDTILSHIILTAPVFLKVYEPFDMLSKETVVILNYIFNEKVKFYHEQSL